ncbi:unnamed protein product [Blepharisma stoltei]|uniref:Uncharacterized protein n=1 Tax=Blepharisma stoltei TaxID=1481888 RepID=A0AAU9JM23_9CILI|nr:unnamed protein product [Blepharisma stoltei]
MMWKARKKKIKNEAIIERKKKNTGETKGSMKQQQVKVDWSRQNWRRFWGWTDGGTDGGTEEEANGEIERGEWKEKEGWKMRKKRKLLTKNP